MYFKCTRVHVNDISDTRSAAMDSKIGACWRCGQPGRIKCPECQFALYCRKTCMYDDKFRHKNECKHSEKNKKCHHCQKITSTRQCSGCLSVWYCGRECQGKNWPSHKMQCLKIKNDIITVAKTSQGSFWRHTTESGPIKETNVYYWGNTPAVDLLNLEQNEWSSGYYPDKLALLLAGVGDLRNVIKTGASLPMQFKGQVAFYLNDFEPQIMARNVLFLYMMCTCDDVHEMAEALVQIWYSLCLTIDNCEIVEDHLEELLKIDQDTFRTRTKGQLVISANHFKSLKPIWYDWSKLSKEGGPRHHIHKQRHMWIQKKLGIEEGWSTYFNCVPQQHRQSLLEWAKDGILMTPLDPRKPEAVFQNVTLLGRNPMLATPLEGDVRQLTPGYIGYVDYPNWFKRETMVYTISPYSFPFSGWDYVEAKSYCNVPTVQTMFANYISHVIEDFIGKVQNGQCMFHAILADCFKLNASLNPDEITFDRITTSNLADHYSIPAILDFFKPFVKKSNPNSMVITELMNWYEIVRASGLKPAVEIKENFMLDLAKETGRPIFDISFNVHGIKEYDDYMPSFLSYLRSDFYLHKQKDIGKEAGHKNIPKISEVLNYDGWKLRDFTRELNRVIPHKWRRNIRHVTRNYGYERNLEWTIGIA
ncbi:uncharacterized protein LOC144452857 [Glandiceps talaboti]